MTAHSVLTVRAAPEWGNSELYKYTKGTVYVMGPFRNTFQGNFHVQGREGSMNFV